MSRRTTGAATAHRRWRLKAAVVATVGVGLLAAPLAGASQASAPSSGGSTYIVSALGGLGGSLVGQLVSNVGGTVLNDLGVANSVSAVLNSTEVGLLQLIPGITVTPDVSIQLASTGATMSSRAPAAVFTQQTGATQLWAEGDTGSGVNVAVLDTGIDPVGDLAGRVVPGVDLSGDGNPLDDEYGHGTFVAGLIAGDGASSNGEYSGEAPGAGLVAVKVAGASGDTDLATVMQGIGWTIAHAQSLNIRVLNLSLGYEPFASTALNPLDAAVEQAWNDGIVVVASAGNDGPGNGTILSPGDDPEIITVGALDDLGQTSTAADAMAPWSSVGPTSPDGWLKPDLVTSGTSVVSLAAPGSTVDEQNPSAQIGADNFVGSGTSFAAAITSGAAALVLSAHPSDTPNEVKAALLGTATPGPVGNPVVDGHGDLDVAAAVASSGLELRQPLSFLPVQLGATVGLFSSWSTSSWNPANWSGLSVPALTAVLPLSLPLLGSSWDGETWNSRAWNGEAWNSRAWNGESWNSRAWNSRAWNGEAWNSRAWNGETWS